MASTNVLFYCNASAQVGFGHLRRCLFIASELNSAHDWTLGFGGEFSEEARSLIRREQPEASLLDDFEGADVAVVDYMFDSEDPEAYDQSLIASVASRAGTSVLITSSRTAPHDLPVDVVVGHLLDFKEQVEYELKAGLKYAPIAPDVKEYRPPEPRSASEINRVFVGPGNTEDPSVVHLALGGLEQTNFGGHVDLLIPPAHVQHADHFRAVERPYDLELHHDVPSVSALMTQADCVMGSYGNMTYEALALGMPTLVIGTKQFMVDYAQSLADQRLLVCVGHMDQLSDSDVATELQNLDSDCRRELSRRGLSRVDGKGLKRVAEEVQTLVKARSK